MTYEDKLRRCFLCKYHRIFEDMFLGDIHKCLKDDVNETDICVEVDECKVTEEIHTDMGIVVSKFLKDYARLRKLYAPGQEVYVICGEGSKHYYSALEVSFYIFKFYANDPNSKYSSFVEPQLFYQLNGDSYRTDSVNVFGSKRACKAEVKKRNIAYARQYLGELENDSP